MYLIRRRNKLTARTWMPCEATVTDLRPSLLMSYFQFVLEMYDEIVGTRKSPDELAAVRSWNLCRRWHRPFAIENGAVTNSVVVTV